MKRRVMFAGVAAIAGLLVPLAAATPPAVAGTGVGCNGSDCSVSVWQFVKLGGAANPYKLGDTIQINVPPPPCLWNPIGNATSGSQYILSQFGNAGPGSLFDIYKSVQQAKKLLANPAPGAWYELPVNPNAGAAGAKVCLTLPLFAWVPPDQAPPMPNVPPVDLAEYAYNHMTIPSPVFNPKPDKKAWVNLATYVHLTTPGVVGAWARLGAEQVWVRARPISTEITSSSGGTPYSNCGLDGSKYQVGHLPTGRPGVPPDCGVLWTSPTTDGTITATVTWRVTWGGAGGGGVLPQVVLATTSGAIRVSEIQSINNGGGN